MDVPNGVDPESDTWLTVLAFAVEMEKKLAQNRDKGPREGIIDPTDIDPDGPGTFGVWGGWLNDSPMSLCARVAEEGEELRQELIRQSSYDVVVGEAADVANMAMMVADAWGWQREDHRGLLERERAAT
jgi:hypothetical protein